MPRRSMDAQRTRSGFEAHDLPASGDDGPGLRDDVKSGTQVPVGDGSGIRREVVVHLKAPAEQADTS